MQNNREERKYPQITRTNCIHDANCLMNDYGSNEVSETGAVMLYIFQSYVLKECMPDLSDMIEHIAIEEMRHHELLGNAIFMSGCAPIIAGKNNFWNGGSVNYCKDPVQILKNNIIGEKKAIANYRKTMCCLKNPSIIELIRCIIMDEERHIIMFEKALNELLDNNCNNTQKNQMPYCNPMRYNCNQDCSLDMKMMMQEMNEMKDLLRDNYMFMQQMKDKMLNDKDFMNHMGKMGSINNMD